MVRNDDEIVRALEALQSETFQHGAKLEVRNMDYNKLSFTEQIANDLETDVMVGPHGAGLMHNIFMPDRAVLVELHIDGSSPNQHFHNLAKWSGHQYINLAPRNPVPPGQLIGVVRQAIAAVDVKGY